MNRDVPYFELVPIIRYYKFDDSFTLEQLSKSIFLRNKCAGFLVLL